MKINIEKIKPNPFQPRIIFDEKKQQRLAKSIKTDGLKKPIELRREKDGTFTIKDGERRFRAMRDILGFKFLDDSKKHFKIIEATDKEMMIDTLIEFCQRENLKPVEKGRALLNILKTLEVKDIEIACSVINRAKDYKDNGILAEPSRRNYFIPKETVLKVVEYMDMLGISGTNGVALLKILELPKDIQNMIIFSPPNVKMRFDTVVSKRGRKGEKLVKLPSEPRTFISLRHAEQLARVKDDERVVRHFFNKVVKDGWGTLHLSRMVDDFVKSNMKADEYFKYLREKQDRKMSDTSMDGLIRSVNNFSSTLTSYRTINLVKLGSDYHKKEFIVCGTGLRESCIRLKKALDEILLDTKQLLEEKNAEINELKRMSFEIELTKANKDGVCSRFTIPQDVMEGLGLQFGDKVKLLPVGLKRLDRGKPIIKKLLGEKYG